MKINDRIRKERIDIISSNLTVKELFGKLAAINEYSNKSLYKDAVEELEEALTASLGSIKKGLVAIHNIKEGLQ